MKFWVTLTLPIALVFVVALSFYKEWRLIAASTVTAWEKDHAADCAVVLTGGPGRVREGLDLLVQENIKKLIISGVHPGAKLREIFPEWPYYSPVNEENVILERRSGTTYGNVQQTLVLVEALHCRDLIVITSHLHMHRARKTFQGVFSQEFPLYFRSVSPGNLHPNVWDLFVESAKSLFYSLWAY